MGRAIILNGKRGSNKCKCNFDLVGNRKIGLREKGHSRQRQGRHSGCERDERCFGWVGPRGDQSETQEETGRGLVTLTTIVDASVKLNRGICCHYTLQSCFIIVIW